jgi:uncharacterized surface protein with fasciclin (FAS1) repeats
MIDITKGRIVGGTLMVPYQTIFENIAGAYTLQTFTALSKVGCLSDMLSDKGPFTVFVPNDTAFGNMKKQMIYTLFEEGNRQKLLTLLAQYVVIGNFRTENFKEGEQYIFTMGGKKSSLSGKGKECG